MSTASNGNRHLIVPTKVDCMDDIRGIHATRNQRRSFVDHGIVNFARFIIASIAWLDQFAAQLSGEGVDSLFGKFRIRFCRRLC
jgi:hypothetical protein